MLSLLDRADNRAEQSKGVANARYVDLNYCTYESRP